MLERPSRRLPSRIDAMPHRTALHEDDRVVSVLPRHRGRQPGHEPRLRPSGDQLEAVRGQMVAFIHDQVAVAAHTIIDDPFLTRLWIIATSRSPSVCCGRHRCARSPWQGAEEFRKALHPLFEQLAPMDEHERADAALRDEPCGHDRLAERCGGGQHAGVVGEIASAAPVGRVAVLLERSGPRGRPA